MSDLIKLSLQKRAVGSVVVSPDVERELHLCSQTRSWKSGLAYSQGREHPARETRASHGLSSYRNLLQMEHLLSHALRH
jgi:hypothetical protein